MNHRRSWVIFILSIAFMTNAIAAGLTLMITYSITKDLETIIGVMIGGGIFGMILTAVILMPENGKPPS